MEIRQEPMFVDIETVQNQVKQEHDLDTISKSAENLMFEKILLPDQANENTDVCNEKEVSKTCSNKTKKGKVHQCSECWFNTADGDRFTRHLRKHKGQNPFQCTTCEYSTYNSTLFKEHEFSHTGSKPYKCAHCPYRCNSKKNRNKHELIHRPDNPLKCLNCDFIARNKAGLKKHSIQCHCSVEAKDYCCRECDFKSDSKKKYNAHKKKHVFECEHCEFKTHRSFVLNRHKNMIHKTGNGKVKSKALFSCQVCSWSSSSKLRILLHLIHHPDQPVDENVIDVSILKKYDIYKGV